MFEPLDYIELPTLTKGELVVAVRDRLGITLRESREIIDTFFELIAAELAGGRDVKLANFGNFELRHQAARPGRNVRTGEPVQIEQRTTVKFIASAIQKELLQEPAVQHPPKVPKRVRTRTANRVEPQPDAPSLNA